jgi:hypothetical protein
VRRLTPTVHRAQAVPATRTLSAAAALASAAQRPRVSARPAQRAESWRPSPRLASNPTVSSAATPDVATASLPTGAPVETARRARVPARSPPVRLPRAARTAAPPSKQARVPAQTPSAFPAARDSAS